MGNSNTKRRDSIPGNPVKPIGIIPKRNRVVLFGAGDAGKSTIARQFLLGKGKCFRKPISKVYLYRSVLEGLALALDFGVQRLRMDFTLNENAVLLRKEYEKLKKPIGDLDSYYIPESVAVAFKKLLELSDVKKCLENRHLIQIPDEWDFLADKLVNKYPRWGGADHIPSNDDWLHFRHRSTGIHSVKFEHDRSKYELIDVGGEKVERKRYLCLEPDVILYVVSLSDYDQKLYEDGETYRLNDSLELWSKIVNNKNFSKAVFILIFNKADLLYKKFKQRGIRMKQEYCVKAHVQPPLPEDDDEDCSKIKQWFQDLFQAQIKNETERSNFMHPFFTNALDINIRKDLDYILSYVTQNFFERDMNYISTMS